MPVELSIVESVTELDTTLFEVILESASAPGPAGVGVPAGGADGQVLTKKSASDYDTDWEDPTGGGGASALVDLTDVTGQPPNTGEAPVWDGDSFELTDVLTAAEAVAGYQPLDSDLTAIAALSTTAFGRGLLILANQAALLAAAGAAAAVHEHAGEDITSGTVADARIAATIARDTEVTAAIAALSTVYQPLDADLMAIAALTTTAFGRSFLALADAAAARALIDLEPGTDVPSLATFNDHSARHEDGGADEISLAGLSGEPADTVNKSLFDANTVLAADTDNTPAAVPMGASTLLARLAAGNIKAASVAEILALLDVPTNAQAILDALLDAKGDIIAATAADTPARLPVGSDGAVLTANSGEPAGLIWATPAAGGASDPVQELFGTAATAFEFQSSSLAGLTAIGTPDTEDADTTVPDCYFVKETNTAIGWNGRYLASPATPWTAITRIQGSNGDRANQKTFLAFASDSAGAPAACDVWMLAGISRSLILERWTNPTTFGSTILAAFLQDIEAPMFLALRVNSTSDVDFLWSPDGWIWREIVGARNPALTIAYLGIGVSCQQAASVSISAAFDYLRIFGSALAFPGAP